MTTPPETPRHAFVPVLGHEIHVTEWGTPGKPGLVMWHGLARTGRDFDELAAALSQEYFILCPDTIGRGLSSWSAQPEADYALAHYSDIATGLLDHYGIAQVGWIGTSMGGLIGLRIASGPRAARLTWLIVNDIGPELPQDAIDRILAYADSAPEFASFTEAEAWFRAAYAPFGPAGDGFWQRMARTSVRRRGDGRFTTHYDPAITVQFTASPGDFTAWDRYARIALPTHLLRGESSDVLPAETARRMTTTGPRPEISLFTDCGHAPALARPADADRIRGIIATLTRG